MWLTIIAVSFPGGDNEEDRSYFGFFPWRRQRGGPFLFRLLSLQHTTRRTVLIVIISEVSFHLVEETSLFDLPGRRDRFPQEGDGGEDSQITPPRSARPFPTGRRWRRRSANHSSQVGETISHMKEMEEKIRNDEVPLPQEVFEARIPSLDLPGSAPATDKDKVAGAPKSPKGGPKVTSKVGEQVGGPKSPKPKKAAPPPSPKGGAKAAKKNDDDDDTGCSKLPTSTISSKGGKKNNHVDDDADADLKQRENSLEKVVSGLDMSPLEDQFMCVSLKKHVMYGNAELVGQGGLLLWGGGICRRVFGGGWQRVFCQRIWHRSELRCCQKMFLGVAPCCQRAMGAEGATLARRIPFPRKCFVSSRLTTYSSPTRSSARCARRQQAPSTAPKPRRSVAIAPRRKIERRSSDGLRRAGRRCPGHRTAEENRTEVLRRSAKSG